MTWEDKLECMFRMQKEFMDLLHEKRGLPLYPVDLSSKEGQQVCREAGLAGIEEAFEAFAHLRNAKKHRVTEVREIDRDAFIEEMSDSLHYFIEVMLFAGVTADELFDIYSRKHRVNVDRINHGY